MSGKDCSRWRRGDCNEEECHQWNWCKLMNDKAVPKGMKESDYELPAE